MVEKHIYAAQFVPMPLRGFVNNLIQGGKKLPQA